MELFRMKCGCVIKLINDVPVVFLCELQGPIYKDIFTQHSYPLPIKVHYGYDYIHPMTEEYVVSEYQSQIYM